MRIRSLLQIHAELYLQMAAQLMGRKFLSEMVVNELIEEMKVTMADKV